MKSKAIKNFYPRDATALKMLHSCGCVTHDQLSTFLKDKRINNYVKDNLIQPVGAKHDGKDYTGYKLTREGKSYIQSNLHLSNQYSSQSVQHDSALANKYLNLSETERATVLTETALQDQLQGLEGVSACDMAYYSDQGYWVAYEVITKNYTQEQIQEKIAGASYLDMQYQSTRI